MPSAKKKPKKQLKTKKNKIKKKVVNKISKNMSIGEIISKYPETVEVFFAYNLHCIGCGVAAVETIEQGAIAHGIKPEQLIKDLNAFLRGEKIKKKSEKNENLDEEVEDEFKSEYIK